MNYSCWLCDKKETEDTAKKNGSGATMSCKHISCCLLAFGLLLGSLTPCVLASPVPKGYGGLEVQVFDSAGQPARGAVVEFIKRRGNMPVSRPITFLAADDGTLAVDLRPGQYLVQVNYAGEIGFQRAYVIEGEIHPLILRTHLQPPPPPQPPVIYVPRQPTTSLDEPIYDNLWP
jgi:hypothetical protein